MLARRNILALSVALPVALAGCGWEPLYANHETAAASADLQSIRVSPIAERIGQRLEMALRSSLNPTNKQTPGRYLLRVSISTYVSDSGIQSQGLGTRGEVSVSANYSLIETATTKTVQTGAVHATDSFDIQANGYSTVVAQDDAYTRTVEEIRREIIARLTLYLQNKNLAKS